jgi:hypothetical protein
MTRISRIKSGHDLIKSILKIHEIRIGYLFSFNL